MKAFSLLVALMALSSLGGNGNGSMNLREKAIDTNRPNGWYYITSGKQDSLSAEPIVTTKDFASIRLDSSLNERTGEMIYQIIGRVKPYGGKIFGRYDWLCRKAVLFTTRDVIPSIGAIRVNGFFTKVHRTVAVSSQ